jgi:diacylglycerol kinase (ATP)
VTERVLTHGEKPWRIMQQIRKESIHQMLKTRFYLQEKEDPHGSSIALFIGNLPQNLSQRQYHSILMSFIGESESSFGPFLFFPFSLRRKVCPSNDSSFPPGNPFVSIGPIYYEYGSVVVNYDNNEAAVKAFNCLKVSLFDDRNLLVMLLPNIQV